jgi:hypothetical protein
LRFANPDERLALSYSSLNPMTDPLSVESYPRHAGGLPAEFLMIQRYRKTQR